MSTPAEPTTPTSPARRGPHLLLAAAAVSAMVAVVLLAVGGSFLWVDRTGDDGRPSSQVFVTTASIPSGSLPETDGASSGHAAVEPDADPLPRGVAIALLTGGAAFLVLAGALARTGLSAQDAPAPGRRTAAAGSY